VAEALGNIFHALCFFVYDVRGRVREGFDAVSAGRDPTVVEGGGRLTTGGIVDLTDPDVAELFDADPVLIAEYGTPADVDEILTLSRQIGTHLTGVLFNRVADAAYDEVETLVAPLEERGFRCSGRCPVRRRSPSVTWRADSVPNCSPTSRPTASSNGPSSAR
jgi:BioD-like phosphotransacetylase family protein